MSFTIVLQQHEFSFTSASTRVYIECDASGTFPNSFLFPFIVTYINCHYYYYRFYWIVILLSIPSFNAKRMFRTTASTGIIISFHSTTIIHLFQMPHCYSHALSLHLCLRWSMSEIIEYKQMPFVFSCRSNGPFMQRIVVVAANDVHATTSTWLRCFQV